MSSLAASDEYGYDGTVYRAMKLPEDVISQYKVEKDSKLNVFAWSGFTSCTRDAATAIGFVDEWELNTVFVIESGGRHLRPMKIEEWSQAPGGEGGAVRPGPAVRDGRWSTTRASPSRR